MQLGALILVCTAVLAAFGTLQSAENGLSVGRAEIMLLCIGALALNTFELTILPELSLNPASVFLTFIILLVCIVKDELAPLRGVLALTAGVMAILLITAVGDSSALITGLLCGIIVGIICGNSRPYLALVCALSAPLAAYMLAVIIRVGAYSHEMGLDTVSLAFDVQLVAVLGVAIQAMATYILRAAKKARAI